MSSNNDTPEYKPGSGPSTSGTNLVREQDNVDLDVLPGHAEITGARPANQKEIEVTADKNGKPFASFIIYVQEALSAVVGTILEGSGPLRGAVRLDSYALTHVCSIVLTVIFSNSL